MNKTIRRPYSLIAPIAFNFGDVIIWISSPPNHGVILKTQRHNLWNYLVMRIDSGNRLLTGKHGHFNWLVHQPYFLWSFRRLNRMHQLLLGLTLSLQSIKLIKLEFLVAAWALLLVLLCLAIKPLFAAFEMEEVLAWWYLQNLAAVYECFYTYNTFFDIIFVLCCHLVVIIGVFKTCHNSLFHCFLTPDIVYLKVPSWTSILHFIILITTAWWLSCTSASTSFSLKNLIHYALATFDNTWHNENHQD